MKRSGRFTKNAKHLKEIIVIIVIAAMAFVMNIPGAFPARLADSDHILPECSTHFRNPPAPVSSAVPYCTASQWTGEILIKYKSNHISSALPRPVGAGSAVPYCTAGKIKHIEVHRVKIPEGADVEEIIEKYENDPRVEFAELNYLREAFVVKPNDPYYSEDQNPYGCSQWSLQITESNYGWDIEKGNGNIVIAVLDTGIDLIHTDLQDKIWVNSDEIPDNGLDDDKNGYVDDYNGWDFANNDNDPTDDHGHGTHVAGIATAETDNYKGIAAMCWGAKTMPVKVLNKYGMGTDYYVAQGIIYAADNGAKVINMSLGGSFPSTTLQNAIDYAHDKRCVVVAAAGNLSSKSSLPYTCYPAACEHVIAVSATDKNDERPYWSNYGSFVDVAAPGENILSTFWYPYFNPPHVYAYGSGTSMATPHVSGLAALVASKYPTLTPDEVEEKIELAADDLGPNGKDDYYGYGRINTCQALVHFRDVIPNYWAFNEIEFMADQELISGYPDGLFRPADPVFRSQFTKMLVNSLGFPLNTKYKGYFTDVPPNHWGWQYIETAYEMGIIRGYGDGRFGPEDLATRAHLATMLVRGLGIATNTQYQGYFPDVPSEHWAWQYIETAKDAGIIKGYPDGSFGPEQIVRRDQTTVMIYRAVFGP
ncbi:MAG: S8 family serine peptidase [Actinomycetota bacterium]|nr:S8 family serine peptidase [Actinomycetota bacterium]